MYYSTNWISKKIVINKTLTRNVLCLRLNELSWIKSVKKKTFDNLWHLLLLRPFIEKSALTIEFSSKYKNERTNERRRIKVKFEEQKEAFHPFVQSSHGMAIQRTPALSISVCLSSYIFFSIVLYILSLLFVKPLICS